MTQYGNIHSAIETLEGSDLAKYIHKLKGSSGSLKMDEIHKLCIKIEAENLNKDLINILLEKMKKLLVEIENNLN